MEINFELFRGVCGFNSRGFICEHDKDVSEIHLCSEQSCPLQMSIIQESIEKIKHEDVDSSKNALQLKAEVTALVNCWDTHHDPDKLMDEWLCRVINLRQLSID